jgi:hypothetical protein
MYRTIPKIEKNEFRMFCPNCVNWIRIMNLPNNWNIFDVSRKLQNGICACCFQSPYPNGLLPKQNKSLGELFESYT